MRKTMLLVLVALSLLVTATFAGSALARSRRHRSPLPVAVSAEAPTAVSAAASMPQATTQALSTATPSAVPVAAVAVPAVATVSSALPAVAGTPVATASNRWVGFYKPGVPESVTALNKLQGRLDKRAAVVNFFIADSESFPTARCANAAHAGATPLVTLEFWSIQNGGLSSIIDGSHDAYLKKFASAAKSYGKTVWLRPFHEMNGNWYPWGTKGANTPAKLVAAYRHVHKVFAAQGATNVKFVWCPNVDFNVASYYPGDSYVDYAAIDGYNSGAPWRSFSKLFDRTYAAVVAVTPRPIFIAETSCAEGGSGKAAWITDMFSQITTKYTRIIGVTWFDVDKERDWRVNSSASSLQAFATGVSEGF